MADARVETVPADFGEVDRKLAQATSHLASADSGGIDPESAYILLYSAIHKALSAALLADGRRVGSGARAHLVLIQEARQLLGQEHGRLLDRLDRARRKRNRIAYETDEIGDQELDAMKASARRTVDMVTRFVDDRRG